MFQRYFIGIPELLCCILLYFLDIAFCSQIECLWQSYVEQVFKCHFFQQLLVTSYLSCILVILNILNPSPAERLQLTKGSDNG